MRPITDACELLEIMERTPGCCLLRADDDGRRQWRAQEDVQAICADINQRRALYFTRKGTDYVRALRQNGEVFLDCVRPEGFTVASTYALADLLREPILVPWRLSCESDVAALFPDAPQVQKYFDRSSTDSPKRLTSYPRRSEDMTFYVIEPHA